MKHTTLLALILASCASAQELANTTFDFSSLELDVWSTEDQPVFDQGLIQALVTELETVVPQHPDYLYPIDLAIEPSAEVNAGAGYYEFLGIEGKHACLTVNQGLLIAPGMTKARLRAILAHEMAHLALGHALHASIEDDTEHVLTRQEELEADRIGAGYLSALGYDPAQMVDAILWLGENDHHAALPWLHAVCGDHASPVMRAALLDPSNASLGAVADFEHGLMYLECGQYRAALPFFDLAISKQPALHEARLMAARAALQDYYEHLPLRVQEAWLRPDFGPMLTDARLLSGRSTMVTAADRRRYDEVRARIAAIPDGTDGWIKTFLSASADVLTPEGDRETIEWGVSTLRLLHSFEVMLAETPSIEQRTLRQRYANNLAVGLARLGQEGEARGLLLAEMAPRELYVPAITGNLGALPITGLAQEQALLSADLFVHFLANTPEAAVGYAAVRDSLSALAELAGLTLQAEIISPEVLYCAAVEARLAGCNVGLFDPAAELVEALGEPEDASAPIGSYPDLRKLTWGEDLDVLAVVERGRLVRLSSKRDGDAVVLKPRSDAVRGALEVRVGVTEAELRQLLDPAGDGGVSEQVALLAGAAVFEFWTYFPALNFGVLLSDGVVRGVTVTPVRA